MIVTRDDDRSCTQEFHDCVSRTIIGIDTRNVCPKPKG